MSDHDSTHRGTRGRQGGQAAGVVAKPGRDAGRLRTSLYRLTGTDVDIGWVLAAMMACGLGVGLLYPVLVSPFVQVRDGQEGLFRVACIVAGLCVGAMAYGVARFTLFRANKRLATLAAYDGLTGLYNQREFAGILERELERAARAAQPVSLLILDLDRFKLVNDEYGHLVGDEVLAAVAAAVRAAVRPPDSACRIGGEEFAIVLPDTRSDAALAVAQRIRTRMSDVVLAGYPAVSVSLGAASYPWDAREGRELVRCADDAMYAAKAAGRDTVRAWDAGMAVREAPQSAPEAPAQPAPGPQPAPHPAPSEA